MRTRIGNLLIGLTALWLPALAQADSAADAVDIDAPYARAVPPGQSNSAVFMTLHNNSEVDHALVAAESPVASTLELHTHIMEGEIMRMRPVDKIELPAASTVELRPGGLHVMLIGLNQQLTPAQEVPITLIYQDGSKKTVQAPARKAQPMAHHH